MKTLIAFYSKTGVTKSVANAAAGRLGCDIDELQYDEKNKTIKYGTDPSAYERVIIMSPVWAMSLAEPMKLYLKENSRKIGRFDLLVTCAGMGLKGCVGNCKSILGKEPGKAVKLKTKDVKKKNYSLDSFI